MSSANFSRPGAVDLSALTSRASASTPPAAGQQPAHPGSYTVQVEESTFDDLVQKSLQYPVVLELTMPAAAETHGVSQILAELADQAQGRWLLARVDVQAQPRIAQALGVQAVPTVIALLGGQAAPLFQGTRDRAEIAAILDEVLRLAAANGVVGRAAPISQPATDSPDQPAAPDPRFEAADEALARGDYPAALAEFERLLAQNPRDTEAAAGRAQMALLIRTAEADVPAALQAAAAAPQDLDAQLAAADLELMQGLSQDAFARLLRLIPDLTGEQRDKVRLRLLELFLTQDPSDPIVLKARRDLSTALY